MSVTQIDNIFDTKLAEQLAEFASTAPFRYVGRSRQDTGFPHWKYSIAPGDESNGLDISQHLPELVAQAWAAIQRNHIGQHTLLRCYINAHTYGIEGYPHTDSFRPYDKTLVVYLNPTWSRDWGGETLVYADDSIAHAELPKFNRGLIFNGNQTHCARGVTRTCPEARLTLMFKFAPASIDLTRDRIQTFINHIGCDQVYHSERRLATHLLNVYDILKANGHDETVCMAGGLHGIMGTSLIPSQIVDPKHRDIVAKICGYPALELVELYRDLQRPDTLEAAIKNRSLTVTTRTGQTRTLTQTQLNNVCALDAANLKDQKLSARWPNISRLLKRQ
jgi:hypothetical protein